MPRVRGKKRRSRRRQSQRQEAKDSQESEQELQQQRRKRSKVVAGDDEALAAAGDGEVAVAEEFQSHDGSLSDWLNPKHKHFREEFAKQWKTWEKAMRKRYVAMDKLILEGKRPNLVGHPFPTSEDDHCETSPEAYDDICPILEHIAKALNKSKGELQLYDPYYCAGATVQHLRQRGFTNVYNKCEDFYAKITSNTIPEHDVFITNPPYSGDHVQKLLDFAQKHPKPCLLLMPSYICKKDYFAPLAKRYAFLYPLKRYVYWTPKGLRTKQQSHVSSLGIRTSPFVSMWYIDLTPAAKNSSLYRLELAKSVKVAMDLKSLPTTITSS